MYHNGIGVEQNTERALEYYHLSASQKNADAYYALGIFSQRPLILILQGAIYSTGEEGIAANLKEAFRFYKLSAKYGKMEAKYSVGLMYENGAGVEQNKKKAYKYYKLVANQGLFLMASPVVKKILIVRLLGCPI